METLLFFFITFLLLSGLYAVAQAISRSAEANKGKTDIRLVARVKLISEKNASDQQHIVELTWAGRPATDPSKHFKVVRFKPPEEPQEVCVTKNFTWQDTQVRPGDVLRYQIITQGENDPRYGIVHQKTSNIVWVKVEEAKME